MWFGLLAAIGAETVGIGILGVGLALTMYVVAGFSEAASPFDVGFKAAMISLIVGGLMLFVYGESGSENLFVLSPLIAVIVGASFALNPTDERGRRLARLAAMIPVGVVGGFVYSVDPLIYGLFLPLIPLAAVGLADNFYERGKRVVAEEHP